MKKLLILLIFAMLLIPNFHQADAATMQTKKIVKKSPAPIDTDNDGIPDKIEVSVYKTNPKIIDTDNDGINDGDEINWQLDPNSSSMERLEKVIIVDKKTQALSYSLGPYMIKWFKISTGIKGMETPSGEFKVEEKRPLNDYIGEDYSYPKTKWNLLFKYSKGGNYYIHGAFWHNRFGRPMSHGCVNVSYANMEALYNWADVGTKVLIH